MCGAEFLVCLMKPQNIRGHIAAKKCVKKCILNFICMDDLKKIKCTGNRMFSVTPMERVHSLECFKKYSFFLKILCMKAISGYFVLKCSW